MPKDPRSQARLGLFGKPPKNATEEEKEDFDKKQQEALRSLPKHLKMGQPLGKEEKKEENKNGGRRRKSRKGGRKAKRSTRRH